MKKKCPYILQKRPNNLYRYMPQICWLVINRKYLTICANIHNGMTPLSKIFFIKENILAKRKHGKILKMLAKRFMTFLGKKNLNIYLVFENHKYAVNQFVARNQHFNRPDFSNFPVQSSLYQTTFPHYPSLCHPWLPIYCLLPLPSLPNYARK